VTTDWSGWRRIPDTHRTYATSKSGKIPRGRNHYQINARYIQLMKAITLESIGRKNTAECIWASCVVNESFLCLLTCPAFFTGAIRKSLFGQMDIQIARQRRRDRFLPR
jgi:hypothetical protein